MPPRNGSYHKRHAPMYDGTHDPNKPPRVTEVTPRTVPVAEESPAPVPFPAGGAPFPTAGAAELVPFTDAEQRALAGQQVLQLLSVARTLFVNAKNYPATTIPGITGALGTAVVFVWAWVAGEEPPAAVMYAIMGVCGALSGVLGMLAKRWKQPAKPAPYQVPPKSGPLNQ